MFAATTVTVHAGDTMSALAQSYGYSLSAMETANPQVRDPNLIYVNETLNLPSGRSVTVTSHHSDRGDGDHDADDYGTASLPESSPSPSSVAPVYHAHHYRHHHYRSYQPPSQSGYSSGSSAIPAWAACIVQRESGGNARAVNSVPGYIGNGGGLFGDLTSTWNNYGGYHQPFQAPASVQIQFNQQLHNQMGLSPWHADGCPGT